MPTKILHHIPSLEQENDYFCGPAVIAMILRLYSIRVSQKKIATLCGTRPKTGTATTALSRPLRRYTIPHRIVQKGTITNLERALARGNICIVLYQDHGNFFERILGWTGHYAIVTGYDATGLYLIDPYIKHVRPRAKTLLRRFKKKHFALHWHGKDGPSRKYTHWMISVRLPRKQKP